MKKSTLMILLTIGVVGAVFMITTNAEQVNSNNQPEAITTHRPTLDPNADNSEIQVYLDAIQAEGTLEAARAQMTATQQSINATTTAHQVIIEATATAEQSHIEATHTQLVWNNQSTATERAWQAELATMETDKNNATATAFVAGQIATSTAYARATKDALQSTADANALNAAATAQAAEAELAHLAIQRERRMNTVAAVAPFVLTTVAIGVVLALAVYWLKIEADRRRVLRNSAGDVTHVQAWDASGQGRIVSADRMPGAAIVVAPNGAITFPEGIDPTVQHQVTLMALLMKRLQLQQNLPDLLDELHGTLAASASLHLGRPEAGAMRMRDIIDVKVVDVDDDPTVCQWVQDVENDFLGNGYLNK
jgi:hypothetical protein